MFNLKLTKMKKIYLTLCMAMIAVFAFAGGVKVSKGKATFMKNAFESPLDCKEIQPVHTK